MPVAATPRLRARSPPRPTTRTQSTGPSGPTAILCTRSAYTSPKNTRRAICGQPGPFGGDTAGCFELANHDREHRRHYDEALGTPGAEPDTFGCWFRDGANQVMRNTALAKSLMARGEVHSASMMLMAPDAHTSVWEQWHRHIALMSQYDYVTFADPKSRKL